ncbi:MAG: prepilin-type N-terminal cleavage/methylation domain-containing protein [Pirellulaceae bacterium]
MKCSSGKQTNRSGLTLLEVMISLAILGTSLTAIGELIRIGADAADRAAELTTAQFLCDSKLAEIKSGVLPADSVGPIPFEIFETEEPWEYMVLVDSVDDQGLLLVEVTVSQLREDGRPPAMVTLTTWMIDPTMDSEADALESEAAAEDAAADSGGTNG